MIAVQSRDRGQICPLLVVSLRDAATRRTRIAETLRSLGLEFRFVDAVDGRAGLDATTEAGISRVAAKQALGRDMADTEFACALSHRQAYEWVLGSGAEGAVVLEDDAEPVPALAQLLRGNVLAQFDFVQFDYAVAYVWRYAKSVQCSKAGVQFERMAANSPLATGYYVSRRAVEFLLDATDPVVLPADWPCNLQPLRPYLTSPRLVRSWAQSEDASYLCSDRAVLRKMGETANRKQRAAGALPKRNPLPIGFRMWWRLLCRRIPKA